jgi:hypothetical protein
MDLTTHSYIKKVSWVKMFLMKYFINKGNTVYEIYLDGDFTLYFKIRVRLILTRSRREERATGARRYQPCIDQDEISLWILVMCCVFPWMQHPCYWATWESVRHPTRLQKVLAWHRNRAAAVLAEGFCSPQPLHMNAKLVLKHSTTASLHIPSYCGV